MKSLGTVSSRAGFTYAGPAAAYQYIKEYKLGHGARKGDNFATAVFVLKRGGGIDDRHGEDQHEAVTYLR